MKRFSSIQQRGCQTVRNRANAQIVVEATTDEAELPVRVPSISNCRGWICALGRRIPHAQFWLAVALSLLLSCWTIPNAWAMGGIQPPVGESAPEFVLPTNTGDGEISLEDYRGQWVVLYFYPQDFTSGCTIEARRFQQDLEEYNTRNVQILGVSVDDVDSHAEFCDSEGLKFPLLADTDGSVSKAYGSWLGAMSLRHTYLIDPKGVLREIFLGVRPSIHSQEVLARLDELAQELSS